MVNEGERGEVEVYDSTDARANSLDRVKLALKYDQKRVGVKYTLGITEWVFRLGKMVYIFNCRYLPIYLDASLSMVFVVFYEFLYETLWLC